MNAFFTVPNIYKHNATYLLFTSVASTKRPEISATLPRPPGHQKHALKVDESNKNRQPSSQEQKDIEELLRSVQEVNFSTTPEQKSTKVGNFLHFNFRVYKADKIFLNPSKPRNVKARINREILNLQRCAV